MAQPKLNLLLDQPPRSVFINGKEWAINSNFYIGIKFEMLIQDKDIKGYELCARALSLYYPTPPDDPGEALSKALWFYSCGRETPHTGSHGDSVQAYSFDDDEEQRVCEALQPIRRGFIRYPLSALVEVSSNV